MGRKKLPKVVPKKTRRTWAINPRTRVHSQEGYRRAGEKAAARRRAEEELGQENQEP